MKGCSPALGLQGAGGHSDCFPTVTKACTRVIRRGACGNLGNEAALWESGKGVKGGLLCISSLTWPALSHLKVRVTSRPQLHRC